jgi:hypothetical protein
LDILTLPSRRPVEWILRFARWSRNKCLLIGIVHEFRAGNEVDISVFRHREIGGNEVFRKNIGRIKIVLGIGITRSTGEEREYSYINQTGMSSCQTGSSISSMHLLNAELGECTVGYAEQRGKTHALAVTQLTSTLHRDFPELPFAHPSSVNIAGSVPIFTGYTTTTRMNFANVLAYTRYLPSFAISCTTVDINTISSSRCTGTDGRTTRMMIGQHAHLLHVQPVMPSEHGSPLACRNPRCETSIKLHTTLAYRCAYHLQHESS